MTPAVYDPSEAIKKLEDLDQLLPQVKTAQHQEKFQKVQGYLKKNNELIVEVMKKQEEAGSGASAAETDNKKALQNVAELIKELNENLTQIYEIYSSISAVKED